MSLSELVLRAVDAQSAENRNLREEIEKAHRILDTLGILRRQHEGLYTLADRLRFVKERP